MAQEERSLDNEADLIESAVGNDFILAAFNVDDWNAELSPWKAKAVFGDSDFAGGADDTLRYVIKELIPFLNADYELQRDIKWVVGGYSLGGLFALYCAYRTDQFTATAAASPSVWFPGFIEYARENSTLNRVVYLSLGDKEEKTKNHVMSTVGDIIRELSDIYARSSYISASALEWNEGNHFREPEVRTARGFIWVLNHILNKN